MFWNSLQYDHKSSHFSACCVFTSCLVTVSNGGRSFSSGFPSWPMSQLLASHNKSSQGLNRQSSNSLTHQPTDSTPLHWLTPTNCPAYNISAWTTEKTPFLCYCSFLLSGSRRKYHSSVVCGQLPSNGRCIDVYLVYYFCIWCPHPYSVSRDLLLTTQFSFMT
jgi:hypothetical protein